MADPAGQGQFWLQLKVGGSLMLLMHRGKEFRRVWEGLQSAGKAQDGAGQKSHHGIKYHRFGENCS